MNNLIGVLGKKQNKASKTIFCDNYENAYLL